MIGSTRAIAVYAYAGPVDMRKGYDGLYALIAAEKDLDPLSGDLYLFVSRNRIRAKVLLWDGTGLCIYAKRLEKGRFAPLWGDAGSTTMRMTMSEMQLYIEGSRMIGKLPLSPEELTLKRLTIKARRDTKRVC